MNDGRSMMDDDDDDDDDDPQEKALRWGSGYAI